MLVPIDEVAHFDAVTHSPSTGAVTDADSTPTFDVFEEATDTAILSAQSFTKRTSLTGDYRGSFTASAANGFEAGKWYNVIAYATVGGVTAKKVCLTFRCIPAEAAAGVPSVALAASASDAVIAGAVWNAATASYGSAGSYGLLIETDLDATISSRLASASYTAPDNASITAIKAKTDNLPSDPADASDIAASFSTVNTTLGTIAAYIDTEVAAIKAKTDNLPASPAAVGSAMTLTSAYDFAKGTVAVTESYAANGVAPTPVQALLACQQYLTMFAIAGTAYTVKKLDGSTTAFIVTLNDGTNPTEATRS